jgi:hypothetical protein
LPHAGTAGGTQGTSCSPSASHLNVTGSLAACVGFGVTCVTETMHAFAPEQVMPLKLFSTVKVVSTLPELSAVTIFTPAMSQSVSDGLATFLHSLTTRLSCGVKPAACTFTDSPELRPLSGVTVMVCVEAEDAVVDVVVVDVVVDVVVVGAIVVDVVVVEVVVVVEGAAVFVLEPQAAEPSAIATRMGTISLLMDRSLATYRSLAVVDARLSRAILRRSLRAPQPPPRKPPRPWASAHPAPQRRVQPVATRARS